MATTRTGTPRDWIRAVIAAHHALRAAGEWIDGVEIVATTDLLAAARAGRSAYLAGIRDAAVKNMADVLTPSWTEFIHQEAQDTAMRDAQRVLAFIESHAH